ncbi:NAD(P)/FAD-dependent oxidoreductase [Chthonobacter albigriseus]|uniref:NAD(P)/FAD-dependent oxidoreductase n=1 Tax=Chthonobacter albigriseus TaxID=1683161 RepID=UPI001FCF15D7|nr:FAD-binding oxidoreductase [Chthonobacter albigriseus]
MYPTAFMPELGRAPHPPSYYAETAGALPSHPALKGARRADVCIIGGGYTGLSAARSLAKAGYDVVVLEANKVGWGASGRNGGQIHPGQRRDPDWMAARLGEPATRRLLALADEAWRFQRDLIADERIDCDLAEGLIHGIHKKSWVEEERRTLDHQAKAWGVGPIAFLDKAETAARLGTDAYFGGTLDPKGGHLHPLKFALGIARAAVAAGATIHEDTRALSIRHGSPAVITTPDGEVTADTVVLAGNGYLGGLDPDTDARVMPLNNFILTTAPLDHVPIPGNEAASDTRFVVYYWRMTADRRMLFGGGETFTPRFPADIAGFVRRHLARVYPDLASVPIDHAWGGTLGITVNRLPFVRRPKPNVWVAAGYSGQGVMLAPFAGHILAEAIRGQTERFDAFADLPCPPFPGGTWLRWPTLVAAMSWFALRDRL